jgi:YidC/Oxa1 family membrane protein insertase
MFSNIYHALVYDPIYNGLVFLIDSIPGGDVGVAVILLTIAVRLILLPLALKATHTQFLMRTLEPELKRLKEEFKDNKELQARKTMALYKEHGVNPFASILFLFIQLFFIFSLYFIFWKGGLPEIQTTLLYSFVSTPTNVNMLFLGLIDVAARNLPLALLAGITQFFQTKLSIPPIKKKQEATRSFKDDLMKSFNLQMRYGLPVLIFFVAWSFSSIIALYFVVSNIVSIGQELYVRRVLRPAAPPSKNGDGTH